ncbi:hypothetical protein DPMN_100924 [Dreissena polymorpha]|uniref:Uncharacterized protein n=1 Tax=Dreissena polymorpha TaxID=45954 RepID=A0A9D4R944_DREPO|nr:hypothetical protein DPMN_100924 [Dreissena polymorpha]
MIVTFFHIDLHTVNVLVPELLNHSFANIVVCQALTVQPALLSLSCTMCPSLLIPTLCIINHSPFGPVKYWDLGAMWKELLGWQYALGRLEANNLRAAMEHLSFCVEYKLYGTFRMFDISPPVLFGAHLVQRTPCHLLPVYGLCLPI